MFRPCGSVVEHSLGKGEVAGPIPAKGTSFEARNASCAPSVLVVDHYFSELKIWQKRNSNGPSPT